MDVDPERTADLVDQLLTATLRPDEVPPGLREVARVLRTAGARASGRGAEGEVETVAMMVAILREPIVEPAGVERLGANGGARLGWLPLSGLSVANAGPARSAPPVAPPWCIELLRLLRADRAETDD
jgi:hypothetical protein